MDIILLIIGLFLLFSKKKTEWLLVIIMALSTNMLGAYKIFGNVLYIPNIIDGALILILSMFIIYCNKRNNDDYSYKNIYKIIKIFFIYLAIITLIDIFINGTSFIYVLKTSRHWLCLLVLYAIPKLPYNVLYKSLQITFYITLVLSLVIIVGYILGIEDFTAIEQGVKRGALPPSYALFYTILLYTGFFKLPKIKKYLYLTILIGVQLISATRSIALGVVLGIAICMYYLSENKTASLFKLGLLSLAVYIVLSFLPGLNKRFSLAFDEFSNMEQSYNKMEVEGNTTFRLYMLAERYKYLTTNPQYYLFGIGNIIEQNFPTTFHIGGFNKEMRRPTQLDTGDISWSPIILRTGMIGLVIYLILTFKFILFKNRTNKDKLYITLKAYLLATLMVISFAGSTFSSGRFWVMPIICISMISKAEYIFNNKINSKNNHEQTYKFT